MDTLQQLIEEQQLDDKSNKIKPEIIANPVSKRGNRPVGIINFTSCRQHFVYPAQSASPEEIAQAKEDSICPRCNKLIFLDKEGVYCSNCGFSF